MIDACLQSIISQNLQEHYGHTPRILTHRLLFAPYGWLKSSILTNVHNMLIDKTKERQVSQWVGSPTREAVRGSVIQIKDDDGEERWVFLPPYPAQFRYLFVDEWGSVAKKNDDQYIDYLKTLLEHGLGIIELVKLANITSETRKRLKEAFKGIKLEFTALQSCQYYSNTAWLTGTNKHEAIEEEALTSRFEIEIPKREFDPALLKHIKNHPLWEGDDELFRQLRSILNSKISIPSDIISIPDLVPDYLIDEFPPSLGNNPRIIRDTEAWVLMQKILCKEVKDNMIKDYMRNRLKVSESVSTNTEELIIQLLQENKAGLTVIDLSNKTGRSRSTVSYHLEKLRPQGHVEITQDRPPKYKLTGTKSPS